MMIKESLPGVKKVKGKDKKDAIQKALAAVSKELTEIHAAVLKSLKSNTGGRR
jgi:DNA-directed RNA polymerase subunit L